MSKAFHKYGTSGSRPDTVAFAVPGLLRMKPHAYLAQLHNRVKKTLGD